MSSSLPPARTVTARCRCCGLRPSDVPNPRNWRWAEADLCVDCAMQDAGAFVTGPDPDDPRSFALDHQGRP